MEDSQNTSLGTVGKVMWTDLRHDVKEKWMKLTPRGLEGTLPWWDPIFTFTLKATNLKITNMNTTTFDNLIGQCD